MSIVRCSHQLCWVARSKIYHQRCCTVRVGITITFLPTQLRTCTMRNVKMKAMLRGAVVVTGTLAVIATLAAIVTINLVSMSAVWRAANLLSKSWQDGVVVYNLDSGSTHLLNPVAGQVLKLLADAPADAPKIACQLACQINLESDLELDYNVATLLNQLDSLGLIEPVSV